MRSHRRIFVTISFLLVSSIVIVNYVQPALGYALADITVNPNTIDVRVGKTATVTVTSSNVIENSDAVVWTDLGDAVEIARTEVSGNTAVVTIKANKFSSVPKDIRVSVGGGPSKTVTIQTMTSVRAADFPSDPGETFVVKQDEAKAIALKNPTALTIPSGGLDVTSADPSFVTAMRAGTTIKIVGLKPTANPVRVTVSSNGEPIKTYDVTVNEAADTIDVEQTSINLTEGDTRDLSTFAKVKGKSGGDLTTSSSLTFTTSDPQFATVSNNILTAVQAPEGGQQRPNLVISALGVSPRLIPIQIAPGVASISFVSPKTQVAKNGTESFSVTVTDSQGNSVEPALEWEVAEEDQDVLRIISIQGRTVVVQGIETSPGATLRASIKDSDVPPVEILIRVKDLSPTGYAPLRIRLDLYDSQTAKDLFGKKANDEFYIAKVRLFNNLKNEEGEYGDSILVYSASLELPVKLQVKEAGVWRTMTKAEHEKHIGTVETFNDLGLPCKERAAEEFVGRYRPHAFAVVANTHDRRDERSTRSRVLSWAKGLSSLGSFVTTIAVPGAGSDLPLGLDKFQNLLIPSFEKLFPSMKEVQRQNIIERVMRPLEEIPPGQDLERTLFIPKGHLIGMNPDKIFRIGAVSTVGGCAEVGVIKKTPPRLM